MRGNRVLQLLRSLLSTSGFHCASNPSIDTVSRSGRRRYRAAKSLLALLTACVLSGALGGTAAADDFETPLHRVCAQGNVEVARTLIEGGANVNAEDMMGRTPLHLGATQPEIVRLLIENGAQLNDRTVFRETALHLAIRNTESVRLLVEAGANVNAKDAFGRTPLDLAVDSLFFDDEATTVTLLVEAGAAAQ